MWQKYYIGFGVHDKLTLGGEAADLSAARGIILNFSLIPVTLHPSTQNIQLLVHSPKQLIIMSTQKKRHFPHYTDCKYIQLIISSKNRSVI